MPKAERLKDRVPKCVKIEETDDLRPAESNIPADEMARSLGLLWVTPGFICYVMNVPM